MFGNAVNTYVCRCNAVITSLIKKTHTYNQMSWFGNLKKWENPGCQVSVQSRRKTHLHSKQSCIQKQKCLTESKTDYFWVTRGCQCLWNVKSEGLRRSTALYLNFILIMILHAVLLNWHITAPWLNYTIFFHNIIHEKENNILKYLMSAASII